MKDENINIDNIIKMLSNMDQSKLEEGLSKASKILNNPNANSIINEINKKNNNNQ